jgi:hypothetical protein
MFKGHSLFLRFFPSPHNTPHLKVSLCVQPPWCEYFCYIAEWQQTRFIRTGMVSLPPPHTCTSHVPHLCFMYREAPNLLSRHFSHTFFRFKLCLVGVKALRVWSILKKTGPMWGENWAKVPKYRSHTLPNIKGETIISNNFLHQ